MAELLSDGTLIIKTNTSIENLKKIKKVIVCQGESPSIYSYAVVFAEDRTGEWIIQDGKVVCSECFEQNRETNFCPHCGARMVTE